MRISSLNVPNHLRLVTRQAHRLDELGGDQLLLLEGQGRHQAVYFLFDGGRLASQPTG